MNSRPQAQTRETRTVERFAMLLGLAGIDAWSEFPQDAQQALFERAIAHGQAGEGDGKIREELAQFLHLHHERTAVR